MELAVGVLAGVASETGNVRRVGEKRWPVGHLRVQRTRLVLVTEPARPLLLGVLKPGLASDPNQVVERHQGVPDFAGILEFVQTATATNGVVHRGGIAPGEVAVGAGRQVGVNTVACQLAVVAVPERFSDCVGDEVLSPFADLDGSQQRFAAWLPLGSCRVEKDQPEALVLVGTGVELAFDVLGPLVGNHVDDLEELAVGNRMAPRVLEYANTSVQHVSNSLGRIVINRKLRKMCSLIEPDNDSTDYLICQELQPRNSLVLSDCQIYSRMKETRDHHG